MARLTRLCVRGVSCRPGSPRLAPFPPPPPQRLPCSAASSVLRGDPTSHARTSQACGHGLPWTARPRSAGRASVGSPGSRASRLPACEGSLTARGPPTARAYDAVGDVAFRSFGQRRHPETLISRLHSPACRYPCPTLRRRPCGRRRMVGATVVRYSFGVGLFHSFLDAGLSRRSRTPRPNDGGAPVRTRSERHLDRAAPARILLFRVSAPPECGSPAGDCFDARDLVESVPPGAASEARGPGTRRAPPVAREGRPRRPRT
jgi:hypothetical protein